MSEELARATSVSKRYGDCVSVARASASFRAGEIHAVCGENGAGKTTLLKLVAGMVVPDTGEVLVGGSVLSPHTPREAIARGVAMVLQHFALVPVFTALENLVLGAEPTSAGGVLDLGAARARARRVAEELGVELPLDARVESLGIGDRQRLEIARALFRDARLFILDEPTAVLTKTEAAALYATLRRLADAGKGIVVVTHKMDEIRAHADVVTVMRRGEMVLSRPLDRTGDLDAQIDEVTRAIMGSRASTAHEAPVATKRDEVVLAVRGVALGRALDGVDLEVRAGEIVGIAGVEGNGQRELVSLLAGDVAPERGKVEGGPVVVVREDRQTEGLVLDASVRDNLLLGELDRFTGPLGILDMNRLEAEARARLAQSAQSGANADDLDRDVRGLSGGNQQKIVVARALARANVRAIALAQPTRGVDLGASRDIHAKLRRAAAGGAGVLVISADLDELRALSDRILVLARGRIVAEMPNTASDEELGRRMLGASAEAPS